jgi:hypothetical protein
MKVEVENPLCRVPVSMILDDSCPVVNLSHFWIKLRKNRSTADMPVEIPVSFLRRFGEWCQSQGVKGKFSFVPMPAGLGTIDLGLPGFSKARLDEWIDAAKEIIRPNFDFTPEMITHCKVVDLSDWTMTDEWEQFEWADEPVPEERLAPYIAAALRILRNIDIPAEGVTSPGYFAHKDLAAYASATLWAEKEVNANFTPFFFCKVEAEDDPSPEIYSIDRGKGEACAHIRACTGDYFAGWEGNNREAIHSPDACITEDLADGRVAQVIAAGWPAVMVSHWPGFYFQGEEVGFTIFKTVVERINRLPNVLWMKTSEIARYWMARMMVDIAPTDEGCRIDSPIACPRFTIRIAGGVPGAWRTNGSPLRQVRDILSLEAGAWARDGDDIVAAFDLRPGSTAVCHSE